MPRSATQKPHDIEGRGSCLDGTSRLLLRRRESVPLMRRLELLLQSPSARGLLPKSKLAAAIGYLRNNWEALKRFLSDGHLPIDNNDAERDLRRIAVGEKRRAPIHDGLKVVETGLNLHVCVPHW